MSAQILPLQPALDARRAKDQRRLEEFKRVVAMLDLPQKRYMLRVGRAMLARSRKKTAGRKNVVDLSA